jgi:hypothetical protein
MPMESKNIHRMVIIFWKGPIMEGYKLNDQVKLGMKETAKHMKTETFKNWCIRFILDI